MNEKGPATNLNKDVGNIGKIKGDYQRFIKKMKVM